MSEIKSLADPLRHTMTAKPSVNTAPANRSAG